MATSDDTRATRARPSPRRPEDWEIRLKIVERMVETFRFERFAYLGLSALAAAVLLLSSVWMLRERQFALATAMFGSTGVLTLALTRLLHMWNQAWKLVSAMQTGAEK
jgi:hypothetical protein